MSAFDRAKFDELSKDLNVTVVRLRDLATDNEKLRIDASYFGKTAVAAEEAISKIKTAKFGDITSVFRKGIFDIKAETYAEPGEGVPFVRIGDLKGGLINRSSTEWITLEAHASEGKTKLNRGDIILSKTAYPAACLVNLDECNVSQDTIAVKISAEAAHRFRSGYIVAFLNSRFGQPLMAREFQGNVQQHLSLEDGKKLRVPEADLNLQVRVHKLYELADETSELARLLLGKAEAELLSCLGLADWNPPEPLFYLATAAQVFGTGRLDPQYYMPAKTIVQRALAERPGLSLGERFESIRDIFDPAKQVTCTLVRNFDVTDALQPILDDSKLPIEVAEIGSIKKIIRDGDVAISRLRAYLREIAVVRTSGNIPSIGSSEFIVLRAKKSKRSPIAPETLLIFLRSAPVQTILKWCQDGSQHPRFSENDLLSIRLPDAVGDVSPTIQRTVIEALEARAKSASLLKLAERAVEAGIEFGEVAAHALLDKDGK